MKTVSSEFRGKIRSSLEVSWCRPMCCSFEWSIKPGNERDRVFLIFRSLIFAAMLFLLGNFIDVGIIIEAIAMVIAFVFYSLNLVNFLGIL